MKESATNIYGLLENLLEWSRLKRGLMDFIPESFNMKQIISTCIEAIAIPDNNIKIKIYDTGIGMNKELINKLFVINERTNRKGTEGEPSTGLGLLLCKGFIEKHNGKIRVESEEGKGSTFSFIIPAQEGITV